MRILNIHIYNLASLEGEVLIDFTVPPLSTAGIFAITGPTGAGKSTILDAICLALYGRTPRYMQARENGVYIKDAQGSSIAQNDPRGILRDGAGEGYAAVTFIGVDKQTYQATWGVRRAKGKPDGNLLKYTVLLKNISTGNDIPGTATALQKETERLVGLNFEQFTRSVLLAQGDFTAFLKAGKDEKSALLEKLTGTQIYSEISQIIYSHYKTEETKLNELKARQTAVNLLKESEIQEIEAVIAQLTGKIQEAETSLGVCQKELLWHSRTKELTGLIEIAEQQHMKALSEKRDSRQRREKLTLVEAVQPTRSWLDQWKSHEVQLNNKTAAAKNLTDDLNKLKTQQVTHEEQLNAAKKELARLTEQKELLKPQIETAKTLDIQLHEKALVVDHYKTRCEVSLKKQAELDIQHTQLDNALKDLGSKSSQTGNWLSKNKFRQQIAEQVQLILSKLRDAKQFLAEEQHYQQEVNRIIEEAAGKEAILIQQSAAITGLTEKIEQGQQRSTEFMSSLDGLSIESLEAQQLTAIQAGKELAQAEIHWKQLVDLRNAKQKNKDRVLDYEQKKINNDEALHMLEPIITQTFIQRNTARELLDKAILAAAANVTDLRQQLIDGDPCPVCGSTEHPYADHDPKSQVILHTLERSLKELDLKYNQELAQQNRLTTDNNHLSAQLLELNTSMESDAERLEVAARDWQRFSFLDQISDRPDAEISNWMKDQIDEQQVEENTLAKKIKNYRATKKEFDANNQRVQELRDQLVKHEKEKAVFSGDHKSLKLAITHNEQQIKNARIKLDELKKEVGIYFPSESWFENWKTKPESFHASITDFADQWASHLEEATTLQTEIESLKGKSDALKNQIEEHNIAFSELQQQTSAAQLVYEESVEKRKALFDGRPVSEIEQRWELSWGNALKRQDALQKQGVENEKNITRYSTQIGGLEKDIALSTEKLNEFSSRLDDWLVHYNQTRLSDLKTITRLELIDLLALSHDWISSEKAVIDRINQEAENTAGILNNRKSDLQLHQEKKTTTAQWEDLQTEEQALKLKLEELRNSKTEQLTLLRLDREQKQNHIKIMEAIQAQEKVFEDWAKLNSLVGSADGKKFRQLAQEYTLDALLSYANHHLETLSKRYLLQRIPETLALQILDQDMGDEVRTVYSLSGGESFLVSLSLALGLASLSSSKLQVESLFIDEGFGSLDATTLNIAMDALERLHDQGRKVGVISHVQELTERIAVQIMVHKQPSGRSAIEVTGF